MPPTDTVQVQHLPSKHRFVADVGSGDQAVLLYEPRGDGVLDLIHTVVPEHARGGGVGDALVSAAVAYARERSLRLIPTCPYVQAWLERHPGDRALFVDATNDTPPDDEESEL